MDNKTILIYILSIMTLFISGCDEPCYGFNGLQYSNEEIAQAVYRAEGGIKTNFPYGVKSINTHKNKEYAKEICIHSIENSRKRYLNSGSKNDFIGYFCDRYCPPNEDYVGNRNLKRNLKYLLK